MDNLTARQKFILNSIIEKGPLDIKGLSQQIDVSMRTILRENSVINDWLKQYKVRISDNGGQLQINGDRQSIDKVRELLGGIPFLWLLTQEQRQVLITAQLLLAEEPIKTAYFSYQFNVVEGTISFYLDKIQKWLQVRNLRLVRKRGYGLEIMGSDWNKRNAFMELIYNYKPLNELLEFLYGDSSDYSLFVFFKTSFGEELVSCVKELLDRLESSNILKSNDVGYFGAFVHMLFAVKRIRSGSQIELPEHLVSDILSSDKFSFIKDIQKLFMDSGIKLPDNELAYLAIHLNGDKYIYRDSREFEELGVDLEDLVKEVIYIVCKKLNMRIENDKQLIIGLMQHFNPALYRLTLGLQVRNPILGDIKEYYRKLYDAVNYACKLVFSKYNLNIPPNEVGYITMHIGAAIERQHVTQKKLNVLVICPNGLSTAKILYSKLKNNFPEIDNVEVCSLRDMNEKINDGFDMVLSTVNIDKKFIKNPVIVSPFLPGKDIESIRELIKKKMDGVDNLSKMLLPSYEQREDYTREDFEAANDLLKNFQLKYLTADSFMEIIKEIVNEVYALRIIEDAGRISQLIERREEQGNVVIPGSHTALIHVRAEEVSMPFVGVYRTKSFIGMKSIGFSSEGVDTFLFMLARKNESNYMLELLGKISISLVESRKFTEVLRLGDIKDIRNELINILNREE